MAVRHPARQIAAATLLLFATIAAPAGAQSSARTIEAQGWSASGDHFLATIHVVGIADGEAAAAEPFEYRIAQVLGGRDGAPIEAFRVGAATGPTQPAYEAAGPASGAAAFRQTAAVSPPSLGPWSPDSRHYVASVQHRREVPRVADHCVACRVCRTEFATVLFARDSDEAWIVDTRDLDGPPETPPTETTCVEVTTRVYWHPDGDRFALVRSETTGSSVFESLAIQALPSALGDVSATPIHRVGRAVPAEEHRVRFEAQLEALRTATDSAQALLDAGIFALRAGDLESADDYLSVAGNADSRRVEFWRATVATLRGDPEGLEDVRRAADRFAGAMNRELAVVEFVAGARHSALEHLGGVDAGFAQAVAVHDLDAGIAAFAALGGDEALAPRVELLLAAGRVADAADLVADLDDADRHHFALRLAVALAQGSTESVISNGYRRLRDDLGSCPLYAALGRAHLAAGELDRAPAMLRTAIFCDPDDVESRFDLADLLWRQMDIDDALGELRAYLEVAGERRGDRERTRRRTIAGERIAAASGSEVVLWDHECEIGIDRTVRCTGGVANPGVAPVSTVYVSLRQLGEDEEAALVANEQSLGELAPGAIVRFDVTLGPFPEGLGTVWLNVTGPDRTNTGNRVVVHGQ